MFPAININNLVLLCVLLTALLILLLVALINAYRQKSEMQSLLLEEAKGFIQLSTQLMDKVQDMERSTVAYSSDMKEGFHDMKAMIKEYMDNLRFDIRDINSKLK